MGGTVAEVGLQVNEFALSETIEKYPEIQLEVEQIVAHDPEHVMPYVWVDGLDFKMIDLDRALKEDSSIDSFQLLADPEEERLYQMDWVS